MSLYDAVQPDSLMSWIRVMVANRMAANGSDWATIFALHNSGTYNNQARATAAHGGCALMGRTTIL